MDEARAQRRSAEAEVASLQAQVATANLPARVDEIHAAECEIKAVQAAVEPAVLVEADATDPRATANALATLGSLTQTALAAELTGPLAPLAAKPGAFESVVHARYNPEAIAQYKVVPGANRRQSDDDHGAAQRTCYASPSRRWSGCAHSAARWIDRRGCAAARRYTRRLRPPH